MCKKAIGSAALMIIIYGLSAITGVTVLLAPLAATCFVHTFCGHLPVARPKAAIAGHFIAALCGLVTIWLGKFLPDIGHFLLPSQIGLAMLLSSALMRGFDIEHPPASATAVFPILGPLPMPLAVFPLHMAWGAAISVICCLIWNYFNPRLNHDGQTCFITMSASDIDKLQKVGLLVCAIALLLICCLPVFPRLYLLGLGAMLLGAGLLSSQHLLARLRSTP